jgi:hydroxymethylglutaryl-CoA reductase
VPATVASLKSTAALDRGELLKALRAFKQGDYSVRMPSGLGGIDGEIARAFNDVAAASAALAAEEARRSEYEARLVDEAHLRSCPSDL